MKNPKKSIQKKIIKNLLGFYKDRIVISNPEFSVGNVKIKIDGKSHYANFVTSKNSSDVDLVRVWNPSSGKTVNYINYETGEEYMIPELTPEEKAIRSLIYSDFFNHIFERNQDKNQMVL